MMRFNHQTWTGSNHWEKLDNTGYNYQYDMVVWQILASRADLTQTILLQVCEFWSSAQNILVRGFLNVWLPVGWFYIPNWIPLNPYEPMKSTLNPSINPLWSPMKPPFRIMCGKEFHTPSPSHHNFIGGINHSQMGMDQYLLIPFLGGWTSIIYQLFWCSPGVQGFDTLPNGFFFCFTHISSLRPACSGR